ncbi:MAG: hypothetical protein ACR2P6_09935 [Gammaproteobacteria bacterium]
MINRPTGQIPFVTKIVAAALICTTAYILLAIVAVPPGQVREFQFVEEHAAIGVLSAIILSMGCAFCMATIAVLLLRRERGILLWVLLTAGFAFLAFDELLLFHERLGRYANAMASSGVFRGWDDIIVILYGVIALPFAIALLPNLLRYRLVLEFFVIGFLFYVIHTLIDSTQEPQTTTSVILEESAKLFSVEFLAMGAFFGFFGKLCAVVAGEANLIKEPNKKESNESDASAASIPQSSVSRA